MISEGLALREIAAEWHLLNAMRFRKRMTVPVFYLIEGTHFLGRWDRVSRSIAISRILLEQDRWAEVIEVLKHEMAHQFVHECLGVLDETSHGETFRRVCKEVGADHRAAGSAMPQNEDGERLLARVAKLLALAGSPNQNEAETAMILAQRLIIKHNLNISTDLRDYCSKCLGVPNGRVLEFERLVAKILVTHFFVEAIWVSSLRTRDGIRGSVLEICGKSENLEIAEYVYGFLHATAERLWRERRKARKEWTVLGPNRDRRTAFLAGVMAGFSQKLDQERKTQTEVHRDSGLVWLKDAALQSFFRTRHPNVRHVRYGGEHRTRAYADGFDQGQRLVLQKAIKDSGSNGGGTATRLLRGS
jgi:predicted SprT family Zn-dependent metalloprotease